MNAPAGKLKEVVNKADVIDARSTSDTIRLWENYREQATLWRAIALLQIPATLIAVIFALTMWLTRSITLNVPAKPLPGIYTAEEIPDSEFIDVSTDFVNLIATYQPFVARRNFMESRKMLVEPMLSKFDIDMLGSELKAIENTARTQVFIVDPSKTQLKRDGRYVTVTFVGDRQKIIAGRELPIVDTSFEITMTTIPHNTFNKYGIVIVNSKVINNEGRSYEN